MICWNWQPPTVTSTTFKKAFVKWKYVGCFKIIVTKLNEVFYITKAVKMFTYSCIHKHLLYECDHLLACSWPSAHIHLVIHPECFLAATMFEDIAVLSTWSYRRVCGPLEVSLTTTHFCCWVTCTWTMVRHRTMFVKRKESASNATLNDSCHTVPHLHWLIGSCRSMVHWRSTIAQWGIPGLLEHHIWKRQC
jgi:hypothetical protein